MKLAFCLFKYFPYGGLQRDFLRIAKLCLARGHEVHVYTMQWEGEVEPGFHLHRITTKAWQNHARLRDFAAKLALALAQEQYDLVIGFNKLPGLHIYYAADVCYKARIRKQRSFFHRLLPRYRQQAALEAAVFDRGLKTRIFLISPLQQHEFTHYYGTEPERFHLLPPGIAKDRKAPENAEAIRHEWRQVNGIKADECLLLMVGSGFKTKGVDRAILALAALPPALRERCHLFVIGQDNPKPFEKLAKKAGVFSQVRFLGGRDDVAQFLLAADLLLHPAYHENTGTVLLEALVAGLPVLTVDVCGYAHYVTEANAGKVLVSPFVQAELNTLLEKMLLSAERLAWRENSLAFAEKADIYHLPEKAADLIELIGTQK